MDNKQTLEQIEAQIAGWRLKRAELTRIAEGEHDAIAYVLGMAVALFSYLIGVHEAMLTKLKERPKPSPLNN